MVRGKGIQKRVMSTTEVQSINEEKNDLEITLREAEGVGIGTSAEQIDRASIKRQISRLERCLEESKPGKLTAMQKDALAKREKELEDILRVGIPTRYEMDHPAKCPGDVRKHMSWLVKNKENIKEYRNIERTLRPGEGKSPEQLRQDGKRGE